MPEPPPQGRKSLFQVPPLIKTLLDAFPLKTYPSQPLPSRCPRPSPIPTLYIFTTPEDVVEGNPSFNPGCLKWQTYLKFCKIDYRVVPSNNHASPSGALPFLITGSSSSSAKHTITTIPSNKIARWAQKVGQPLEEIDIEEPRVQAFLTLVNTHIRAAWLYTLYLENNTSFSSLYRSTSVSIVNAHLSNQTRLAALAELTRTRRCNVNPDEIYADADMAFAALSKVLADDDWFFGGRDPGLFDAVVFAYTYLISKLAVRGRLGRCLRVRGNLMRHWERILETVY